MVGLYDLLAAAAAAAIGVTALLAVQRRIGLPRDGRRGELVRYFGVAALSALVCAVMNVLEHLGGGVVAAAVGNATNVFAPAMVWAGGRRLNARRDIGAATAGASALLMLAVTFIVSLDDATLIKTAGIAVFCVLATVELRRRPLRDVRGTAVIAYALLAFAVYNAGRIVIALTWGTGSGAWNSFASAQVTSVASAIVILVMAAAAVPLGRDLRDDPEPGSREFDRAALRDDAVRLLTEHGRAVGLTLQLPELELIRAAHGTRQADEVVSTLRAATRDAFPADAVGTVSRDTVTAILSADIGRSGIYRDVHERFAQRMRAEGHHDVPDLRILQRSIEDDAQLDEFLRAGRRPRSWFGKRQTLSR